jgi:hypothetical protein
LSSTSNEGYDGGPLHNGSKLLFTIDVVALLESLSHETIFQAR